jgi:hypothetical protein
MAARELIEKENVLSLEKGRVLFGQFYLRPSHKLLHRNTVGDWITHPDAKARFFGLTAAQYRTTPPGQKRSAAENALKHFECRAEVVFQRRHDCIHNCDRPKVSLQQIRSAGVMKRIEEVEFLVDRCHESFLDEFGLYLSTFGFSGATRNQVWV